MVDERFYELVKHLWRDGEYAYYWTPDTDEGNLSIWFPASKPKKVIESKSINLYFPVHPSGIQRGQRQRSLIETVTAVNCLFAEFDLSAGQPKEHLLEAINQLDIPPSVIVFSGGGYHCYWLLDQTYHIDSDDARQRIIDIQYAWDDFVTGDNHVKDLARVLRIPGTYNCKPEYAKPPLVEIVKFDLDLQYGLDELNSQVEDRIIAAKAKKYVAQQSDVVMVDLDDHTIVEKMRKKDKTADALWGGDISGHKDDHSNADLALCNKLAFWFGRDRGRIDRAFRASGLMRPKWLRDDYRNRTLDKAIADCTATYTPHTNGTGGGNLGNPEELVGIASAVALKGSEPAKGNTATPGQINDDMLLAFDADDWGNAQSVYLLYGQDFFWSKTHGYLHWNGKYWEAQSADARLTQAVVNTLIRRRIAAVSKGIESIIKKSKPDASTVQACIYFFKAMVDGDIGTFDSNPDFLNCNNGVIDLRTGVLSPHDSSQRFTYCIPVDYDPTADYSDWVNYLDMAMTREGEPVDAAISRYMKIAAGYTITGHTNEECLFYAHGVTRSGKGTFAETIQALLGEPLLVQADFSTFTAKREGDTQNFDLAPLKPARVVIASESNKYETLNEAKIKTVTGGDSIRCAYKHKDHFSYRPQFKIWLFSNHPIKGDVDDDAFWGRVKIISFPNSYLGREDKTLKRKMKSKQNLRGVLRWLVEGAMEWFSSPQGLNTPADVNKAVADRRYELDYVQQWLDACCNTDNKNAWTPNPAVYYSYKGWCEGIGIMPKGLEALSQILSKKGLRVGIQKRLGSGKRERGVEGITII